MSEFNEWEKPVSDTTIKGLNALVEKLVLVNESIDALDIEVKALAKEKSKIEVTILNVLKNENLAKFDSPFGKVQAKVVRSIKQPESMEDKVQFFNYLQEQGIFTEMVSVNSRTLSSWATKEIAAHESKGEFGWVPPGLKPASEFTKLDFKRK